MKRSIVKIVLVVIGLSILWTLVVISNAVMGWWHSPLTDKKELLSFSEAAEARIERQFRGSLAMALIEKGQVKRELFRSSGRPVDRFTVFQVASLSKWITSWGVMKLAEDGQLDLDAPVSRYLSRWQLPSSPHNYGVTTRRLLSHTAGTDRRPGLRRFCP